MALTRLNSEMIELPAHINQLTTAIFSSTNIIGSNSLISNLTALELYPLDINFPVAGGNIYNNTNLYGNLTVTGTITALSGQVIVPTTFATTTALSVVNIGAGIALYVSQATPSLDTVFEVNSNGTSILKVNNAVPDNSQAGVVINYPKSGPALRVSNVSGDNVFVVSSGDKVGINVEFPNAQLDIRGTTYTTQISSLTGIFNRVASTVISAQTVESINILSNTFIVSSFQATQSVVTNNFTSVLTANLTRLNLLTADRITVNTLNALTANVEVFDITQLELSGFRVDGILETTDFVFTNSLTGNSSKFNTITANSINVDGNVSVDGVVFGNVAGEFSGIANAQGQFDGIIRINNTTAPTMSTDPGVEGSIAYTGDHFYVCVSADRWKRVALAGWS